MVDLHCHILPGLDDGAATMEESVAMAEGAIADGITHVVATPHSSNEYFFRSDLHCHILPGLDDGAATMEESVAMAEGAIADGITHVVATPHSSNEYFFDFAH